MFSHPPGTGASWHTHFWADSSKLILVHAGEGASGPTGVVDLAVGTGRMWGRNFSRLYRWDYRIIGGDDDAKCPKCEVVWPTVSS